MAIEKSDHWRAGSRNLITDVAGLRVGNAADHRIKTGVTVLTADMPFRASVDVMGGAPGTRETDALAPDKLINAVDALVLAGGSAFGLDAAGGVMNALRQQDKGFAVGPVKVPIVPSAIIFDLINGGDSAWTSNPYAALGRSAFESASEHFEIGSHGAGTGATTAVMKGGLGSASLILPSGISVGALVVANPHGHVAIPGKKAFWAAPFEIDKEFGGFGLPNNFNPCQIPDNEKFDAYAKLRADVDGGGSSPLGMNTTIAIVATDADLDKAELKRMAVSAQDGMSRAIVPSHTPFDGDLIFSLSTAQQAANEAIAEKMLIGHAAAVCLSRAIARAVFHASVADNDTLPSWGALYES